MPISQQRNMIETSFKTGMIRTISSINCTIWGGGLIRAGALIMTNTVVTMLQNVKLTVSNCACVYATNNNILEMKNADKSSIYYCLFCLSYFVGPLPVVYTVGAGSGEPLVEWAEVLLSHTVSVWLHLLPLVEGIPCCQEHHPHLKSPLVVMLSSYDSVLKELKENLALLFRILWW